MYTCHPFKFFSGIYCVCCETAKLFGNKKIYWCSCLSALVAFVNFRSVGDLSEFQECWSVLVILKEGTVSCRFEGYNCNV